MFSYVFRSVGGKLNGKDFYSRSGIVLIRFSGMVNLNVFFHSRYRVKIRVEQSNSVGKQIFTDVSLIFLHAQIFADGKSKLSAHRMSRYLQSAGKIPSELFHNRFSENHRNRFFRIGRVVYRRFRSYFCVGGIVCDISHIFTVVGRPYFLIHRKTRKHNVFSSFRVGKLIPVENAYVIALFYIITVKFRIVLILVEPLRSKRGFGPALKRKTFSYAALSLRFPAVSEYDSRLILLDGIIRGRNVVVRVCIPVNARIEFVEMLDSPVGNRQIVSESVYRRSAYAGNRRRYNA